jgi:large subunit ribosomal protein L25
VYGLGTETVVVTVPARELGHILAHGINSLITLRLDGEDQLALARQIQRHPTRGEFLHVDFVRVRRDVAISADVALHLLGDPEGVKSGGLLEQVVFSIPVEAKPQDIPTVLEIDVSQLEIGDQLHVADVALPRGVVTHLELDALVAQVVAPRVAVVAEGEAGEEVEGEAVAGTAEGAPTDEDAAGGGTGAE